MIQVIPSMLEFENISEAFQTSNAYTFESRSLLSNITNNYVAFKIRTTNQNNYSV